MCYFVWEGGFNSNFKNKAKKLLNKIQTICFLFHLKTNETRVDYNNLVYCVSHKKKEQVTRLVDKSI